MPLWLALLIGVLAWTPIACLLACLVGRCLKDCDASSQVALSRLFMAEGARQDPKGRS